MSKVQVDKVQIPQEDQGLGIKLFGACDCDSTGRIKSEYPSFYMSRQMDELKQESQMLKRKEESGNIHPMEMRSFKARKQRIDEKIKKIENSTPKLRAKDKDYLCNFMKYAGAVIRDAMPSNTDMQKGLADAHREAKMMMEKCLPVGEFGQLFEANGIKPIKGKVSRTDIERFWKISSRLLEDDAGTNVEVLRRDYNYGTYQSPRSLEAQIAGM